MKFKESTQWYKFVYVATVIPMILTYPVRTNERFDTQGAIHGHLMVVIFVPLVTSSIQLSPDILDKQLVEQG